MDTIIGFEPIIMNEYKFNGQHLDLYHLYVYVYSSRKGQIIPIEYIGNQFTKCWLGPTIYCLTINSL